MKTAIKIASPPIFYISVYISLLYILISLLHVYISLVSMYTQSLPNTTATSQVLYLIKCQLPQAPEHMATTVWAIQADASVTLHMIEQPDQHAHAVREK